MGEREVVSDSEDEEESVPPVLPADKAQHEVKTEQDTNTEKAPTDVAKEAIKATEGMDTDAVAVVDTDAVAVVDTDADAAVDTDAVAAVKTDVVAAVDTDAVPAVDDATAMDTEAVTKKDEEVAIEGNKDEAEEYTTKAEATTDGEVVAPVSEAVDTTDGATTVDTVPDDATTTVSVTDAAANSGEATKEDDKQTITAVSLVKETPRKTKKMYSIPRKIEVEEYFIKYKNFSYLHCDWRTEEELLRGDKRVQGKVRRYKQKRGASMNLMDFVSIIDTFLTALLFVY